MSRIPERYKLDWRWFVVAVAILFFMALVIYVEDRLASFTRLYCHAINQNVEEDNVRRDVLIDFLNEAANTRQRSAKIALEEGDEATARLNLEAEAKYRELAQRPLVLEEVTC